MPCSLSCYVLLWLVKAGGGGEVWYLADRLKVISREKCLENYFKSLWSIIKST